MTPETKRDRDGKPYRPGYREKYSLGAQQHGVQNVFACNGLLFSSPDWNSQSGKLTLRFLCIPANIIENISYGNT